MKLIDLILNDGNLYEAMTRVIENKGAPGIDGISTKELETIFMQNKNRIKKEILSLKYRPQPVRRVYIPKPNGKKRPLGIPTVMDRVIQQAIAQVLIPIFDETFSEHSYGFRPNRSAHGAIEEVLGYLNDGCEWVIDLDIEKYFDTVNHDKLISILREKVNDKTTLHLIRAYLKAGVMEAGLISPTKVGVPQGGPLSPVLSNIYLDKFDKELENRGLRFVRYADDCNIFVKTEMAANRVMKSVTSWLERKLFLKVSATKTKIVRPLDSTFLGFGFWKSSEGWKCKPAEDRKERLKNKIRMILLRKEAIARPLAETFTKLNQVLTGWINYFYIGSMKRFMEELGKWIRHKVRVVIIKQWKRPRTIYKNLMKLNIKYKCRMTHETIYKVANTRKGLYRKCQLPIINYLLNPEILGRRKGERPGLVNPLKKYKECCEKQYKCSAVYGTVRTVQ